MGRAPCCDKANVKRGPWSPDEDELLKTYIQQHGTGGNWISLPPKAGLKRCGKSCRLRWLNYLRPDIRHGGFTEDEDRVICSLYNEIGSRWSVIAAQLQGRTDNDVKNHWNTKLKKKILLSIKEETNSTNQNLITTFARTSTSSQPPYFRSDIDNYRPQYSISQPNELFWDGHGSSSDALSFVHGPIQHPACLGTSSLGKPLMRQDASSLSYLSSMAMVEETCASVFPNSIKEEDDNSLVYNNGGFGVPYNYDVLIDGFWSSQANNKVVGDDQDAVTPIRTMQNNFQRGDDYHGYNNVIVDINPQVLLQGDNIFKEIS